MNEQLEESDAHGILAAEALARCDEVALYSEEPDRITRTFLCEPMRGLLERMSRWMEEAGLKVRIDAAGNLIGHYDGIRPTGPLLAIGSHIDSVPNAGKYDGVLGVLLGIAAVKALGGRRLPFGIDVIAFSEEEGVRFGLLFWAAWQRRAVSIADFSSAPTRPESPWPMPFARSGSTRRGSMRRPIRPAACLATWKSISSRARCSKEREAPAGVVEAIAGQSRIWADLEGRAGHAGTTPMAGRFDALAAAAELVLEVERLARLIDGLTATVGALTVDPVLPMSFQEGCGSAST